nr:unknown [Picea sitchensis]
MMGKDISEREQSNYAGLTAVALAAAMVIPEMAEAAVPGVSASLKNFLLSIASGSVVLGAIGVAVVGVSSFDPVKRS